MNTVRGLLVCTLLCSRALSAEYAGSDFLLDTYEGGLKEDNEFEYINNGEEDYSSHGNDEENNNHPKYHFDYSVHNPHTDDYKSHQEYRDGDMVQGYYSVKDADGSLREVHYTADDKNGFKAIVTKNGQQVHPQAEHRHSTADHQSSEYY